MNLINSAARFVASSSFGESIPDSNRSGSWSASLASSVSPLPPCTLSTCSRSIYRPQTAAAPSHIWSFHKTFQSPPSEQLAHSAVPGCLLVLCSSSTSGYQGRWRLCSEADSACEALCHSSGFSCGTLAAAEEVGWNWAVEIVGGRFFHHGFGACPNSWANLIRSQAPSLIRLSSIWAKRSSCWRGKAVGGYFAATVTGIASSGCAWFHCRH